MPSSKKSHNQLPLIGNPKARHKFLIGDKYEAGIVLTGTEVKSIRSGNAQISESFARIIKEELFLFNAHIAEYEFGGDQNHATQRPRKLLLKKKEIERIRAEIEAAGKTIVPLRLYFKDALIKCELAVGTGKNQRDKRQDLKKRVANREAEQALKKTLRR
ncbi:MAG: SsrA-binding protein [Opitutae bacterium]|nr:SsrA-binding protein [Opitutae bacterium]|tara:strand:+ start:878 stop:1357 length:480 start_codon:yes stop_codon:yes gene_type:complete